MRHARHDKSIEVFRRAAIAMTRGQKYIVIVYDGPDVPQAQRSASFISDAPEEDVAQICRALSEQLRD
jgi:hypothetical protein